MAHKGAQSEREAHALKVRFCPNVVCFDLATQFG